MEIVYRQPRGDLARRRGPEDEISPPIDGSPRDGSRWP